MKTTVTIIVTAIVLVGAAFAGFVWLVYPLIDP